MDGTRSRKPLRLVIGIIFIILGLVLIIFAFQVNEANTIRRVWNVYIPLLSLGVSLMSVGVNYFALPKYNRIKSILTTVSLIGFLVWVFFSAFVFQP
jgi:hypothetical protein